MKMITTLLAMFCLFGGMGDDSRPTNTSSEDQVTTEQNEDFATFMRYRELAQKQRDDWIEEVRKEHGREPIFRTLSREEQALLGVVRTSIRSPPVGDYSQLQYTIRMNRPGKYKQSEPIFISRYVKNMTDSDVCVYTAPPLYLFSADIVSLKDTDGNNVPMADAVKFKEEWVKKGKVRGGIFNGFRYVFLQPRDEIELKPGPIVLNHYFDMTRPGVYHLTFHRIAFHEMQRYDEPLASNTLTIEVLDEPIRPEDLRDPGEFHYPPLENPATEPERPVE